MNVVCCSRDWHFKGYDRVSHDMDHFIGDKTQVKVPLKSEEVKHSLRALVKIKFFEGKTWI